MNEATTETQKVSGNSRNNSAVTQRLMSPVGRGMSDDTSPSPTTPPKLKKTPGTSTLEAAAAISRAKSVRKITDYFSQSVVQLSTISNKTHLTNGVDHGNNSSYEVYENGIDNNPVDSVSIKQRLNFHKKDNLILFDGNIKPMSLEDVLISAKDDNLLQDDVASDIIYATPEELEEDGCSRDSSNFGNISYFKYTRFLCLIILYITSTLHFVRNYVSSLSLGLSSEDSGPGKENEDWRAKQVSNKMLGNPPGDVDLSPLTNQTNGSQVNQTNYNLQKYHSTNFMLNNLEVNAKDKPLTMQTIDKGIGKIDHDQSAASSACNKSSKSNHSSPLQSRRGKHLFT